MGEKKNEIHEYELSLTRINNFKFIVDFGKETMQNLLMDEDKVVPGGEELGPTASMLLAAAVGNCLSASLTFCLMKKKVELNELKTKVTIIKQRNEEGFWRIKKIKVVIDPTLEKEAIEEKRYEQCVEIFRKYCIVSTSIEEGIPIEVNVNPT
ncbi:MAG: OsmC family protein [Candidatus Heimdallarchaeaceae archaeon]